MTIVKQRALRRKPKGLFKRHGAPRGSGDTAIRRERYELLNEIEQDEAEKAIAEVEAELEHPQLPAPKEPAQATPKPLGYTSKGPLIANSAYANKSDLEKTAQLIKDLDLEPGTRHGIRVIRASPGPGRRR